MTRDHHYQGVRVKSTERIAKSVSISMTGIFATLGGLLHISGTSAPKASRLKGSGAFKIGQAIGAPKRLILAALAATLAALTFTAAPALATGEHVFASSFGRAGSGPGEFSEPAGVALNETTGDVYVVDEGNDRVEVFDEKGGYLFEFNGSGGDPAVEGPGSPAGTYPGRFSKPAMIAVDDSTNLSDPSKGDVYVADTGNGVIDKFSATGAYLGQIGAGEPHGVAVDVNGEVWVYKQNFPINNYSDGEPNEFEGSRESQASCCLLSPPPSGGLAVDSEENLYVVHKGNAWVAKLDSGGELLGGEEFGGEENVSALAVELPGDDVYIDHGSAVDRRSGSGSLIESLGSGLLKGGSGVAVNSSTGNEASATAYVADAKADVVDVFPALVGAGISEELVTNVEGTVATLQAQINPDGYDTAYHFEYDTSPYTSNATHGTSTPAVSIGEGEMRVAAGAELHNLAPGTNYYYRAVAQSDVKGTPTPVYGPDKTFTTNAAPSTTPETCANAQLRAEQPYGLTLPDCRAYEIVSPREKNDNNISFIGSRASVSGEALTYLSRGSFSEPQSAQLNSRYIARRGASGWSTQNISPPFSPFTSEVKPPFEELLFAPDLSKGVVLSEYIPLVAGEPAGYVNLYLADIGSDAYQLVTTARPPGLRQYEKAPQLFSEGASIDLGHVVFQEAGNLTGGSGAPSETHVYEWVDGALSRVDVPPAGVKFETEDGVGAPGTYGAPGRGDVWRAVSGDGSRVFFTAGEGMGEEVEGQLFVRENPMSGVEGCSVSGDACTVEVSASQKTNGGGPGGSDPNDHTVTLGSQVGSRPARYWDASVDGSRVFFTSRAELTDDANTGPADNAENLYEYDLENGVLTDLTVDDDPGDVNGAAVLGVATASEDGSYVYFVAEGALTGEGNAEGETAVSGEPNLYVYHGGGVRFIATLAPATAREGTSEEGGYEAGGDANDWRGEQLEHSTGSAYSYGPGQHTVRVAGGGAVLAFESLRGLTGFDNQQAGPGECGNGACGEVYTYDAVTGRVNCVSCDRTGARPTGPAELGGAAEQEKTSSLTRTPFYPPRNLSEDGKRLFFQSPDALVPQDSNGLLDVYEWESDGEGGCVGPEGCVLPISDVAGGFESHFMDASPNGEDVFIATKDQLVPAAYGDSRVNVYDARVGGGFPVLASPPVCTNADSCKPPASPQPGVFGAPASATFSGPGNAAPPPLPVVVKPAKKTVKCKKPRKLTHGKCLKPKKKTKKAKKANKASRATNDRRDRS